MFKNQGNPLEVAADLRNLAAAIERGDDVTFTMHLGKGGEFQSHIMGSDPVESLSLAMTGFASVYDKTQLWDGVEAGGQTSALSHLLREMHRAFSLLLDPDAKAKVSIVVEEPGKDVVSTSWSPDMRKKCDCPACQLKEILEGVFGTKTERKSAAEPTPTEPPRSASPTEAELDAAMKRVEAAMNEGTQRVGAEVVGGRVLVEVSANDSTLLPLVSALILSANKRLHPAERAMLVDLLKEGKSLDDVPGTTSVGRTKH